MQATRSKRWSRGHVGVLLLAMALVARRHGGEVGGLGLWASWLGRHGHRPSLEKAMSRASARQRLWLSMLTGEVGRGRCDLAALGMSGGGGRCNILVVSHKLSNGFVLK